MWLVGANRFGNFFQAVVTLGLIPHKITNFLDPFRFEFRRYVDQDKGSCVNAIFSYGD